MSSISLPQIDQASVTHILEKFLDHYAELGISNYEAALIVHVMQFKSQNGKVAPISAEMLAERMGISPTQVRSHLRRLRAKGMIELLEASHEGNVWNLSPLFKKLNAAVKAKGGQL